MLSGVSGQRKVECKRAVDTKSRWSARFERCVSRRRCYATDEASAERRTVDANSERFGKAGKIVGYFRVFSEKLASAAEQSMIVNWREDAVHRRDGDNGPN